MKRESAAVWAKRIERHRCSDLSEREFATEIGVNVHTLYREFSGSSERASAVELFGLMAEIAGTH